MRTSWWQFLKQSLAPPVSRPLTAERARRILAMQRNIVMPVRVVAIGIAFYYLFYLPWLEIPTPRSAVLETAQNLFVPYILLIVGLAAPMFIMRRFPPELVQWFVFTMGLLDGALLAVLTVFTGGFQSTLFWCFAGLIFVNAISIPAATPQIALNLLLSGFYMAAGLLDMTLTETEVFLPSMPPRRISSFRTGSEVGPADAESSTTNRPNRVVVVISYPEPAVPEKPTEPVLLRLTILWLLTVCGYGLQLLFEKQRVAQAEQQEMSFRQAELKSAGRIAAEVAHRIKNPLAIINNAVYMLQKSLRNNAPDVQQQLKIIEEEVARSDKILTELVGYAELSDGHVEKVVVQDEIRRAIEQVFPPNAGWPVKVHYQCERDLPPLWMVRRHLNEVLVNLLQNAREAMQHGGNVFVTAKLRDENTIEIRVSDEGPGIPPDKLEKVFEAYYTTKPKGSGLGLAIVKHNVELYDGTVRAESVPGKGATFIVTLPVRVAPKMIQ